MSNTKKGISPDELLQKIKPVSKPEISLPNYNEIPNVGLFLEQVSKYINEYIKPLGQPELTGSMISNYVKKDIITNPVKKQYGRDQIACLMFIAIAKSVLSLEDIRDMLLLQKYSSNVQSAYAFFCEDFITVLNCVFDGNSYPEVGDAENEIDMAVKKLCRMVSVAAAHKIYLDITFRALNSD